MDNINHRTSYLFNLYYKKQATQAEIDELFLLLNNLNDEQLSQLMQANWDNTGNDETLFTPEKSEFILNDIFQKSDTGDQPVKLKHSTVWGWGKIAALAIITLSIGLLIVKKSTRKIETVNKAKVVHDALPGDNRAILTLSNGDKIALDNSAKGIVVTQGNIAIVKSKKGCINYKATNIASTNAIAFNTITTPKGGQYQVILPDGSKVWLNALSSLKFPTQFTGNERRVEITGEAYFEVAKNAQMPFIVKTEREEVKVLGTHFDVMDYKSEGVLKTTLLEGSILLTTAKSAHVLKPGNQAMMDDLNDLRIIQDVDVDQVVAWKDGFFQFKDTDIKEIMSQAERWYDVDVSYLGNIPTKQFTGKISRNVNLSEMLGMFKYAGINFSIEGKKITIIN